MKTCRSREDVLDALQDATVVNAERRLGVLVLFFDNGARFVVAPDMAEADLNVRVEHRLT